MTPQGNDAFDPGDAAIEAASAVPERRRDGAAARTCLRGIRTRRMWCPSTASPGP